LSSLGEGFYTSDTVLTNIEGVKVFAASLSAKAVKTSSKYKGFRVILRNVESFGQCRVSKEKLLVCNLQFGRFIE
jgi:hypothetical protein